MHFRTKIIIISFLFLGFVPLLLALTSPVYLNQFFLQTHWLEAGSFSEAGHSFHSAYTLGLKLLLTRSSFQPFNYTEPRETLAYLFANMPDYAYVYPTETYYYFIFHLDNITYAGNFRLLDADQGKLHIAYYDKSQPHGDGYYAVLDDKDGLTITKLRDYVYEVHYRGMKKIFQLTDIALQWPKQLQMLPEEEFVARIIDESGIKFFLLYNNKTASFYYVLDEEQPVADTLSKINDQYLLGRRTNYVFYADKDYKRKFLVGVSKTSIFNNDYYDGPFDQVPPRLPLKEKLEAAYPYTKYAGRIDAYGNFYSFKGSRVAISPYLDYATIQDLLSYHARCKPEEGKSLYWSCLTYEWKKDFHKTLEAQQNSMNATQTLPSIFHAIYTSQGWPANHNGDISLQWPATHTQKISSTWQADYKP